MSYCLLNDEEEKFQKKRVLLRIDWNVSFDEKKELNEFKIQASMATIAWLLKRGASIIIVTHWSRPSGFEYKYSTVHLIKVLKKYGYDVIFIPTVSLIKSYSHSNGQIFLLENIRFLPHEKTCSSLLAHKLLSCIDIFVQDGFGILAKEACVTTVLPPLLKQKDRFIGFLIEKELAVLDEVRKTDPSKNVLLIGGAKVPEKLMALQNALSIATKILLMPPLVATYQAALGCNSNGNSILYKDLFPIVHELISHAQQSGVEIIVPLDFQIKTDHNRYSFKDSKLVQQKDQIMGIGPKTVILYENAMKNALNVFMTGISGFVEERESWYTGSMLFKGIGLKTRKIIAGGDSVTLMQTVLGLDPYNSTFLTGGSASFTYLSSGKLVGLSFFKKEDINPKN